MKLNKKILDYIKIVFLPLLLAVLFVAQNQMFNWWSGLYFAPFFWRLCWVTFALGIVFYGPAVMLKQKYRYWYLLIISFFISLVFIAEFLYYKYSQSFLQFSAIRYFHQAKSILGTVQVLLSWELLLFLSNLIIVLIALYINFVVRRKKYEFSLPRWEQVILIFIMLFIVVFGYKYLLDTEREEWGRIDRLYSDVYDLKSLVGKIGIVNFFIEDGLKYTLRTNLVKEEDREFLKTWAQLRESDVDEAKYFGVDKGKNLIIIEVESLEASVINRLVNGQEITPNLNKLANSGIYFDNYYAPIGPGNTADAEFSTMNSLYPLANDVVFINYAKNTYKALPKLLVDNGYSTYTLHGDVPTFWNRSNIYPGLGWQKVYNLNDFTVTRSVGEGPSDLGDEDLFNQSVARLKSFKEPFMAMVITMSSHTPFILPEDLQTLKIAERTNLDWLQWQYLQSIHYVDKAIGQFIEELKKEGIYDNSVILIWGDHDSFTKITPALSGQDLLPGTEEWQLYKNLEVSFGAQDMSKNILPEFGSRQVPMIILNSNAKNKIVKISASHLDIYPTITNLLGIKTPKSILGQDLLNTKTPVVTLFKEGSGGIDAILTKDIVYKSNDNGEFANSSCKAYPYMKDLPITSCQKIYEEQVDNLKASNIIIRGNLLSEIE